MLILRKIVQNAESRRCAVQGILKRETLRDLNQLAGSLLLILMFATG
jgi:hypothetical protein